MWDDVKYQRCLIFIQCSTDSTCFPVLQMGKDLILPPKKCTRLQTANILISSVIHMLDCTSSLFLAHVPKTATHWHQQEERNETESGTQIANIKLVIAIFCLYKNSKLEPAHAKVPEWSDRKKGTEKKDKRHITSRQKDGVTGLMKMVKRLRAAFQIMSRQCFLQRRYSFPQKHTHTHIHSSALWWKDIYGQTLSHTHRETHAQHTGMFTSDMSQKVYLI